MPLRRGRSTEDPPHAAESGTESGAARPGEGIRLDNNVAVEAEVWEGSKENRSATNLQSTKWPSENFTFAPRRTRKPETRVAFRGLREGRGGRRWNQKHVHKPTFPTQPASPSVRWFVTSLRAYLLKNVEGTDTKKNCIQIYRSSVPSIIPSETTA